MSEKTCNNCNNPQKNCFQGQETRARDRATIKKLWISTIIAWIVALISLVAVHTGWI